MEIVDMSTWPRRGVYEFFSPMSQPFYSLTFNVDVTSLHSFVKKEGLSFYYALTWLVTRAVNRVDAFSYSIENGQVVKLDARSPSFTDMKKGAEIFHIVTMAAGDDLRGFCNQAAQRSRAQEEFIDMSAECGALIFISCLPWVELTAFTNERDFDRDDCVPRVTWGKYALREGRLVLGMSLEVNHRMIDGVHIGQFAKALEEEIAALKPLED